MERRSRLCYLDLLRIIGCFLVILNHTPGYIACFDVDETMPLALIVWHLFVGMIVKNNVPIFFMISGALLLKKDVTYNGLFRKILRMFLILLGFSLVANITSTGGFYAPGFVRNFASATVDGAGAYWYLYAYIGILLMLPFLRSAAVRIGRVDVIYLILARVVITGILPMLMLFLNILFDSNMHMASHFQPVMITVDCVFYLLVGYGLDTQFDIADFTGKKEIMFGLMFLVTALLES